jgi:hypothetical protein
MENKKKSRLKGVLSSLFLLLKTYLSSGSYSFLGFIYPREPVTTNSTNTDQKDQYDTNSVVSNGNPNNKNEEAQGIVNNNKETVFLTRIDESKENNEIQESLDEINKGSHYNQRKITSLQVQKKKKSEF